MTNYSKYSTLSREPFFEVAKKYISENSLVLDVGAGDGRFANYAKHSHIYLLDGNEISVNKLKQKYQNVYLYKLPTLPFENDFFNLIHCSHVIEHLQPAQLYKFLIEVDRCLKNQGYFIISTPLLWDKFYDDLSHIRPYTSCIFEKYLCNGDSSNTTRKIISDKYEVVEKVFRYRDSTFDEQNLFIYSKVLDSYLKLFRKIRHKAGFRKYKKIGYTLVLKRN